jgi:adenylate kinase family enzyme
MQRILVIGPCGAGKSTLAMHLAQRLKLPLFHMDQLNWKSGWVESSKDEIVKRLNPIMASDTWLIDGNYGGTLAPRLARADTILYLDYPIRLCVVRLLKRIWKYRGKTRPDMANGCVEKFDLSFLFYVLTWNSGPKLRTESAITGYEDKVIRFKGPAHLESWLASLSHP